ncbi:MAG: ABC transporter substrate-binding protein [Gilvibacter sp.]
MQKLVYLLLTAVLLVACKEQTAVDTTVATAQSKTVVTHAQGLKIEHFIGYSVIEVSTPWPDAKKPFRYALINDTTIVDRSNFDAVIQVPIKTVVATSTTHIPSLEMLGAEDRLVGFPFTNYVSSTKTRALIDAGSIKELGGSQEINTEVLLALAPELVIGYGVDGTNKNLSLIEKAGIPVIYNGDWMEQSPLGKAEWIKFFGALLGKQKEADQLFDQIESDYNQVKEIASRAKTKPTVISGAMYKDVWYLPQGSSWAAAFIHDANGDYLYKDTTGSGSLSLSLETVLTKAQNAEYWIGPGQFKSLEQMTDANAAYAGINAFANKKVFSFTKNVGPTGGVIYYELAPNRPDLVLKDIVKMLHPDLLPEYQLHFFSPLD